METNTHYEASNAGDPSGQLPSEVSSDDRTLAVIAHAGGIFFSFIPSLIIWILKKEESPFVSAQAKEALNFQISIAIYMVVCYILAIILIGFLLIPIVYLVNLVLCIVAAVKASEKKYYLYPLAIRLIK